MNNPITSLFKAIFLDIVGDFKTIILIGKRMNSGEPIFRQDFKEGIKAEWKRFSWTEFFIAHLIPLMSLVALAFFVGFFVASQRYEVLANEAIIEVHNACNMRLNPLNYTQALFVP